jgi:Flp pilus assembly pilin Flp
MKHALNALIALALLATFSVTTGWVEHHGAKLAAGFVLLAMFAALWAVQKKYSAWMLGLCTLAIVGFAAVIEGWISPRYNREMFGFILLSAYFLWMGRRDK